MDPMRTTLISVVIPCFNVEDYIRECVVSCKNQSYKEIDIICVDNNSSDNTLSILEELKLEFGISVYSEVKKGACAARNTGFKAVKTEFVQFLDADDILKSEKLKIQIQKLQESNADFLASDYEYQEISGKKTLKSSANDPWKGLFTTNLGITSANLFRSDAIRDINGWNESLTSSQEYDLMFRLKKAKKKVVVLHNSNTVIRQREVGSITQSDPSNKWKNYINLRLNIIAWLKKENPTYYKIEQDYYEDKLYSYFQILYKTAPYDAVKLWKDNLKPMPGSNLHKTIVRISGFSLTQKILNGAKKIR